MSRYDPIAVETKWQKIWDQTKLYEVGEDPDKQKIYATPMLPYPSGVGLHVGHVRNYSISDVVARYHRQQGFNVMSNIGFDSFGLPAENFAIKTGTPPWISTQANIKNFRNQLKRLGISFDWSREIDTSDPEYYKWTQWVFLKLFEKGLAYQAESLQWWCPHDKTVLANEQVENGRCWRCGHEVERKRMKQWFFKITDYADRLLDATDALDWPESIKTMQKNWIGRSVGAEVDFKVDGSNEIIKVFTTRPDTIFGATFMVLAPEHPFLESIVTKDHQEEINSYISLTTRQTEVSRMDTNREKTGVFTGAFAVNPANGEKIPVWVADYVLMGYGTGAIMAVPAHDERDWEFAQKFGLPVIYVFDREDGGKNSYYDGEGKVINSGKYDGLKSAAAKDKIVKDLANEKLAAEKVNYKIHDWLISRQRYWGAPIPIIHCPKDGAVAVHSKDLPVKLPEVKNFEPTGGATSVLATVEDWVNVPCPKCGGPAKRETDTMDGYACSSWYMLRYTDAHNTDKAWDPAKANYWLPVDFYFGGDHAVSHLLYFRFWNYFFADQGWVNVHEPVKKLVFNGYINAEDGTKMSKSKGNVVDPLEVIDSGYGADALRIFELFIGPYDQDVNWNTNGVAGCYRFLNRVWTLTQEYLANNEPDMSNGEAGLQIKRISHKAIKKVSNDLPAFNFNTAIAAMMEAVNQLYKAKAEHDYHFNKQAWHEALSQLLQLLAPFAPHIAEELWHQLGYEESIHVSGWPKFDAGLIQEGLVTLAVQINGKVRGEVLIAADASEHDALAAAKEEPKVAEYLKGHKINKVIYVPQRLLSLVIS